MKLGLIVCLSACLLACGSSKPKPVEAPTNENQCGPNSCPVPPPKKSKQASLVDCIELYQHMLDLAGAANVESYNSMTEEQKSLVRMQLHKYFEKKGTTGNFLSFCSHRMTVEQVNCSKEAATLESLQSCVE